MSLIVVAMLGNWTSDQVLMYCRKKFWNLKNDRDKKLWLEKRAQNIILRKQGYSFGKISEVLTLLQN